jgi:hypothetical protein
VGLAQELAGNERSDAADRKKMHRVPHADGFFNVDFQLGSLDFERSDSTHCRHRQAGANGVSLASSECQTPSDSESTVACQRTRLRLVTRCQDKHESVQAVARTSAFSHNLITCVHQEFEIRIKMP